MADSSVGSLSAAELDSFRFEVADFLDNHLPDEVWEGVDKTTSYFPPFSVIMTMHKLLATKGWSVVGWPEEYGGPAWGEDQRHVFWEEYCKRGLPMMVPQSVNMVAPAIMQFGTPEQKSKYLPGIISGEHSWCQGYSEPNAGSDLVALQCKAESDGDDYVITGQKIWTTWAFEVDHMFLLVRTSNKGKPQQGITFLLLDSMELPGMEVRPIIGLDGFPEQAEVFFNQVRVPKTQILGEHDKGWSVAKYLLEHERSGGGNGQFILQREIDWLMTLAAEVDDGAGGQLADDAVFKNKVAQLLVDLRCLAASENYLRKIGPHHQEAAQMASMIKLESMDLTQHVAELALEVCGSFALADQYDALTMGSNARPIGPASMLTVMAKYLNHRACSIYGGSHQVQREILSKMELMK